MDSVFSYGSVAFLTHEDGGNGAFVPEGSAQRLRIAQLIRGSLSDVKLASEIAFMCVDEGVVRSGNGLENFVETEIRGIPAVIFDNHNHALYFWYRAREAEHLENGATLVHIDMHSDMWENENILKPEDASDLEKVWKFANYSCNVGNYIKPAMAEGLIGEMVRIEGEQDLIRESGRIVPKNSILNLDLDFFAEELDDIDFGLKKRVISHFANQVSLITVSTSPFFVPGVRAIAALNELFGGKPR